MLLEHLRLANFRNYVSLDVEPAPGLNLFVGPNAQGKSNALEAIAMLATGKSFRAHREAELVRSGETLAEIGGRGAYIGRLNSAALHDRPLLGNDAQEFRR